ncbi:hypothetical protein TGAM01_v205515 [Trichoderma gamsii]|uniref:Antigenic cell wall galactomannoprotein n=1 Tax=Trichoderma gamsii TaxID=398673 RepID=A0A2P4ZMW9_9HYPO|nr:hypothetical protein TGAM01_v205515 [Trichoderma gamsii]PON25630.1 hypothetical protein TGAM01_v205515 [Trichoderma gamsii]
MASFAKLILLASAVAAATTQLLASDETINDISYFPIDGLTGAEEIENDAIALIETLKIATGHVKETGSLSVVGGLEVLAQIEYLIPPFMNTLATVPLKSTAWNALEGPGLALEDLKVGKQAFSEYLDAIIAAEPYALKSRIIAVKMRLIDAFDEIIKIYPLS